MKNMSTTVKFVFKKNMLSNIFVFYGFVGWQTLYNVYV